MLIGIRYKLYSNFAVTIDEKKIKKYIKTARTHDPTLPKNRKKKTQSINEIKLMFAEHFNHFAKLEDAVIFLLERGDSLEKEMV